MKMQGAWCFWIDSVVRGGEMNKSIIVLLPHARIAMSILSVLAMNDCLATQNDIPEQSIIQELPVVLSPSRLHQPLSEAPNAMTVIDRAMIEASGFRNIPDLFRLVPGMYVSFYTGSHAIVGYHGVIEQYARRMQVLVDGRTVYMSPTGGVNWEDLPLQMEDIERIEVIRGPAAASYGGNSIQGVISIITRDAGAQHGFKASVTRGNGGISDASLNFGDRGETLDYRVSLGYRSDDGYDASQFDVNYDDHATRLFNLRAGYHPNTADSLDVQFGYSDGPRGVGSPSSWPDVPHDTQNTENFQQVTWLHSQDDGGEFRLQLYHIFLDELNSLGFISDNYTSTRDEIEMQITSYISNSNRLVWGTSVRRDRVLAPNQFLDEQALHETTLFAHDEWRITPLWILNAGAMLANNGLGRKSVSPRAALNYHFTKTQTLRAGISRAYRNPSLFEERSYYHFIIPGIGLVIPYQSSGGLYPEEVLSREIGYLGEFADKGYTIDVRIYRDQFRNIIYETFTPPKDYLNMFGAQHDGLELTSKHQWGDRNQLTVNYAYQVLRSDDLPAGANGSYSSTMPRNMISVLYAKTFAAEVTFSLGYYQQGTMVPIDRPDYDRQKFTRRVDARIAKRFGMNNDGTEGEIALVVQHPITDKYIDYRRRNQFNQRAFLTVSFDF